MLRNDNASTYTKLRQEFPVFTYQSYHYSLTGNKLSIDFEFKFNDTIILRPASSLILPGIPQFRENVHSLIENIVFNIGMIELISYWKAACSPVIKVTAGLLDRNQIEWWKNLYFNGLGEFFYLNTISATENDFVDITSEGKVHEKNLRDYFTDEYLVPIGGGKDSAVTLELLNEAGYKVHPLIMNPRGATLDTVKAAEISLNEVVTINRAIDPLLLKLNDEGFLNGHTPFSAMLAFYTLLASALTGYRNIVLSNESSANEATIPGTGVNHQYSKSIAFEQNFREYYSKYIHPGFNYFSFLRPLNEIQIMKIFSSLERYHKVFKSCNVGSKTNSWCGSCPKCLFTHIMLSAYKGVGYSNNIIGQPMLDEKGNTGYFDELCGFSDIKPFECVGTINDVKTAMRMIINNEHQTGLPRLAQRFKEKDTETSVGYADHLNEEHFVSEELITILNNALR